MIFTQEAPLTRSGFQGGPASGRIGIDYESIFESILRKLSKLLDCKLVKQLNEITIPLLVLLF